MQLREIMSKPAQVAPPETSVARARAQMSRARVHHLVATKGRNVVGVVSQRDLEGATPDTPIEALMSSPAVTAPASMTVRDAAKVLRGHAIGSLPILERGRVVGMVTITDLLALLGKGSVHVNPQTGRFVLWRRGAARAYR